MNMDHKPIGMFVPEFRYQVRAKNWKLENGSRQLTLSYAIESEPGCVRRQCEGCGDVQRLRCIMVTVLR